MDKLRSPDFPVEEDALLVVDDDEATGDEAIQRSLAEKLWTENSFNTRAFKQTIVDAWRLKKSVEVQELGKNLFLFTFSTKRDLENVLNSGPWNFDRHVLALKRITGVEQPSEMTLDSTSLWTRVYDLPLRLRSENMAMRLGNMMGKFEEADNRDCNRLGKFLRVKVLIDLKKPVRRGTVIRFQGKDLKVFFRYERLPAFCFICGKLGHQMKECDEGDLPEDNDYDELEEKDLPYGPWLRASPLPKQKFEPRKESQPGSCSRSLFASSGSSKAEVSGNVKEEDEVVKPSPVKEPTLAQLLVQCKTASKEVEEVAESLGCIGITPKVPATNLEEVDKGKTDPKTKASGGKAKSKQKTWVRKKGRKPKKGDAGVAKNVDMGKRQLFEVEISEGIMDDARGGS